MPLLRASMDTHTRRMPQAAGLGLPSSTSSLLARLWPDLPALLERGCLCPLPPLLMRSMASALGCKRLPAGMLQGGAA